MAAAAAIRPEVGGAPEAVPVGAEAGPQRAVLELLSEGRLRQDDEVEEEGGDPEQDEEDAVENSRQELPLLHQSRPPLRVLVVQRLLLHVLLDRLQGLHGAPLEFVCGGGTRDTNERYNALQIYVNMHTYLYTYLPT